MGFVEAIQNSPLGDPSGDGLVVMGQALRGMGAGTGVAPAAALAEGLMARRREEVTQEHTRGFIAAIESGANPQAALKQFPATDTGFLSAIAQHRMQQREALDAEARREAAAIRAEGRAQAGQRADEAAKAEDEAAKAAAIAAETTQADAARRKLAAPRPVPGFMSALGLEPHPVYDDRSVDPNLVAPPSSDASPLDLPGTPYLDQSREQVPDVTDRGFIAAGKDYLASQAAQALIGAREANAGARTATTELKDQTRSDTKAYYDRLVAAGMDPSKVDASDLTSVDPGVLRSLIAADAAAKRQDKSLTTVPAATTANNAAAAARQNTALGTVPAATTATNDAATARADKSTALQQWKAAGAPLIARDKADDARLVQLRTLVNSVAPKAKADPKSPWAEQLAGYKAELDEIAKRKAEYALWQQQGEQFKVK
jgi:hypothetical protein